MSKSAASLLALSLSLLCACGGGPRASVGASIEARDVGGALGAYERFVASDGSDARLLAEIAALVLELEALGVARDRSDSAIAQLRLAGNAGIATLRRVAASEGVTLARAKALGALHSRRDRGATAYLFALLDAEDPEIVAEAVAAIDPEDEARLLALLDDTSPSVRRAAAARLAARRDSVVIFDRLVVMARVDPDPRVRAAAIRALGEMGASAVPMLRERLADSDHAARQAVIHALVRADAQAAVPILAPLLGLPPGAASIEAARVLAGLEPTDASDPVRDDAFAYLRAVLHHEDASLRAQASIALVSLRPSRQTREAALAALEREEDRGVRLGLARALSRDPEGEEVARAVLLELLGGDDMPAVQAAAVLAEDAVEPAVARLEAALSEGSVSLRRVAARALARDARMPEAARRALEDEDALVRISAAGGILAATNR